MKYIQNGKCAVLVDGQFGSTGKGLLAAYLAGLPENRVNIATTNASANAGHWTKYKDPAKRDFCCYHLPTFGVVQPNSEIYLNAGSVINPQLLFKEMIECGVDRTRVTIHPNAAIITQGDIDEETHPQSNATRISSTRKGVGAALARKVRRAALVAKDCDELAGMVGVVNLNLVMSEYDAKVSLEVPQGYSLGVDGPFYPYCTSRNCTVGAGLSDAGIHPSMLGRVAMANRTYPIRVGSIPNVGYSGDVYDDQEEISFETLGVEPELTTVTKRVRRIFTWSNYQMADAMLDNRPSIYFLNFCNYLPMSRDANAMNTMIQELSCAMLGGPQHMLQGWGPNVEDVIHVPWRKPKYDS